MEGSPGRYDEQFEVSDSPETAAATPGNEGANVCRAAALSSLLGADRTAVLGLNEELVALGFPEPLSSGEFAWDQLDWLELLDRNAGPRDPAEARLSSWRRLRETARPSAAVSFLVAVLGSELERESAAAAAALWPELGSAPWPPGGPVWPWLWNTWTDIYETRGLDWPDFLWWGRAGAEPHGPGDELQTDDIVPWQPHKWSLLFTSALLRFQGRYARFAALGLLGRWRLALALRSPDPITRSLATAAFLPTGQLPEPPTQSRARSAKQAVSTMIHGTFGWKGDWWRPRPRSFHDFILKHHRRNLYDGGARFSWSGAYSDRQRDLAASDFCDWAGTIAPHGLQTVFAHSYGGEIAARALLAGAPISELVLLSSPVNNYVRAAAHDPNLRIVDVRLRFDPVLALARVRQRLTQGFNPVPANVTPVILKRWTLDHSATHREDVWRAEQVAKLGGI